MKRFQKVLPSDVDELARLFPDDKPLYLVGGAVRDTLLGLAPLDYDFTTSALPAEVKRFAGQWADDLWTVGEKFGTIGILKRGVKYEITTFRAEVYDERSRKPTVAFSTELEEDLVRRDFTVNAMAWAILGHELVDLFDGRHDLAERTLRTPGAVETSFADDPLRMLRALRYHATLDFYLSDEIIAGIIEHGGLLTKVSAERIADEFSKIMSAERPSSAVRILFQTGLCRYFLPELSDLDLPQPTGYHHKNVLEHTLQVVDTVSPELVLRLAALFHDIAKPRTRQIVDGVVHFYHHEYVGGKMTRQILRRLKYSKQVIDDVSMLVEMHLRPASYRDDTWTDSAVRRYIRDAGELLDKLNELASADCTSLNPKVARQAYERQKELEYRIDKVREEEDLLAIRPYINGHQIMKAFGLPPGPAVGRLRSALLEAQIEGSITSEEQAWEFLKGLWEEIQSETGEPGGGGG